MLNEAMLRIQQSLIEKGFRECTTEDIGILAGRGMIKSKFEETDARLYFGKITLLNNPYSLYIEIASLENNGAKVAAHLMGGFATSANPPTIGHFDKYGFPSDSEAKDIMEYLA